MPARLRRLSMRSHRVPYKELEKTLRQAHGAAIQEAIQREASHFGPRLAGGEAPPKRSQQSWRSGRRTSRSSSRPMALLERTTASLPSRWYYDESQYKRELDAIWYRDWVCVGRAEELPRAGDYLLARIGTQRVIVTRDAGDRLRAFHNTCRHRGSALCTDNRGRFRNGRIVCPYHTWTYSTAGELIATPGRVPTPDFRPADYSLYPVRGRQLGRFRVRVARRNAGISARGFPGRRSPAPARLATGGNGLRADGPAYACLQLEGVLGELQRVLSLSARAPGALQVVGIYGKGFINHTEDPEWRPADEQDDGRPALAPGHRTWAIGGETGLPDIEGPEEERAAGMIFASFTASMFVIAHRDYARSVPLLPLAPEAVELTVDWLLPRASANPGGGFREDVRTEPAGRRTGWPRLRTQSAGIEEPAPRARRAHAAGTRAARVSPMAEVSTACLNVR